VIEQGTLQTDGTCDMATNVIHGAVQSGAPVWDAKYTDHELPVSYYWRCKPNFLGSKPWPLVGPDVAGKTTLPATERFAAGTPIAPTYARACADGSAGTAPGVGGFTSVGGTTSGGVTGTGAAPTTSVNAGRASSRSASGTDSGCACRVAGSRSNNGHWLAIGVALALFLRRRR
jgi:MYXO-CTERM domain-containing protein